MKEPRLLILKKRQKEHDSVLFVGMGPKKAQKCLGIATHLERVEAIWREIKPLLTGADSGGQRKNRGFS